MGVMNKISGYFKQFAGEVSGNQAMHDEGRREVGAERGEQAASVEPRVARGAGIAISADPGRSNDGVLKPQDVTGGNYVATQSEPPASVIDYSDTEQLKLYRLVPIAAASDTNWDLAPNQGEVVVRARSSGDARVVAAEAELDFMEIDALPGDGNSTTSSSAFRSEKLYTVVDETNPDYPVEGPRGVVAGTVRVDNIRPTEL
jgi:hypothetical protein